MDVVGRAIEKQMHINNLSFQNEQTWEAFEKVSEGKKVFLFGTGAGTYFFWARSSRSLEAILDNDSSKWNIRIEDLTEGAQCTSSEGMPIDSADILLKYSPDETVILVSSLKRYDEIVNQLYKMGHKNVFILLLMEADYREKYGGSKKEEEYLPEYLYVQEFCNKDIVQNKIMFMSFGEYSDHGKYITEQLLSIRDDLDIVWLVDNPKTIVPAGVRVVCTGQPKRRIYEMETAHIWVINTEIPCYIKKRQGQIYIHTKHWASVTLKRFYLDSKTITDIPENVERWRYNSRCMDYIITGSDFDTASCRRGFEFEKDIVQVGSPRSDAMFRGDELRKKVLGKISVPARAKILLYAPTYRYKQNDKTRHIAEARNINLDLNKVKAALEKRFGNEWYILLRLHPAVAKESKKVLLTEYTIDVSDYGDSQELASACDVMISDYSSFMFEPAFVKKPVFLYAPDRNDYIDKEYDLLINYDSLPFPIAESNDELVKKIEEFDIIKYEQDVTSFMDRYGVHEDGHASERAAAFISSLI